MTEDNPFALLEEKARRLDLEDRAAKQVSTARTKVLLGRDPKSAFFTVLVLGLDPVADWSVPTLATDGKRMVYNPEYVSGLSLAETMGVSAHEGLHVGMGHHARRGDREPVLANIAMDLAINPLLLEAGYTLPTGALIPGRSLGHCKNDGLPPGVAQKIGSLPTGLCFEEYYSLLQEPPKDGDQYEDGQPGEDGSGDGEGNPDPGGCGGVLDAAQDEAGLRQAEELRKGQLYRAEEASRSRGSLPRRLARLVEQTRQPTVHWQDVLREFITRQAKSDYRWTPPNRRFAHTGLYLPSFRSEAIGRVLVAVDTSGSIRPEMLSAFGGEIEGILGAFPGVHLTILYHDSIIQHVQEWTPQDGPLALEPIGGGGTSHVPVFEWIEEHAGEGDEEPACLVALTDLETEFPEVVPELPVLWAVVGPAREVPFGQVVEVK